MSTGISGLDDILGGGLTPQRFYLVEGTPGTGKTTVGLQYLLDGVARDCAPARYADWSGLAAYCEGVASSVGEMCTHVFGVDGDDAVAVCESALLVKSTKGFAVYRAGANHFRLQRRDGRWQIVHRTTRALDGGTDARHLLASGVTGRPL